MTQHVPSLAVFERGPSSAPMILFLHGLGVSSWMWKEQIDALQEDYHCVAVDLPGSGGSHQVEWHSLSVTADQLATLIERKAARGRAHVVGLSLGGYVALSLMAQHPQLVDTVLVTGVTTRPLAARWFFRPFMRLMNLVYRWDVTISLMARTMQLPDEVMPLYRRDSKRLSRQMFNRVNDEIFEYTLPRPLVDRPHRLLAMAGDGEGAQIREGLTDVLRLIPNAVAALVPNAHHAWSGEHPALFADTVRSWVEGEPLPERLQLVTDPSIPNNMKHDKAAHRTVR